MINCSLTPVQNSLVGSDRFYSSLLAHVFECGKPKGFVAYQQVGVGLGNSRDRLQLPDRLCLDEVHIFAQSSYHLNLLVCS